MREYDEMTLKIAGRIFEKGDEILEKRRKRTVFIKKLSLSVSGVCAAVIAGAAVWHNNDLRNSVHHEDIPVVTEVPQTEASEESAETAAAQTTAPLTSSTSSKQTSAVSSAVAADIIVVESTAAATVTSSAAYEEAVYSVITSAASVDTVTTTAVTTASNTEVSPVTTAVNTAVTVPTEEIAAESAVRTWPSSYVEHTDIPEQAYPVTTVKTTAAEEQIAAESEVHVTETKADYIKNGRFIRRLDYTEKADDSRVLLDENGVQHRVKVQYADSMSADEIIAIMGNTSFCDTNVFSFSGMYEGITSDTFFFVIEHYSYVPETETIYSTKMKVYCVQLDDGSKAYAVKLPQSDGYYLYTVSEKTDEEIYWRER